MEEYYRRKVHQMHQDRIENKAELIRKKSSRARLIQKVVINLELILSIFIKVINVIMIFVWCAAVSSLDSDTVIPSVILVISTIYLAVVAYLKGYMSDGY